MKIMSWIVSKIKGEDFSIDNNISFIDLLSIVIRRLISVARGIKLYLISFKKPKLIFVGKYVKLYHRKKIFIGKSSTIESYVEIDALSKWGVVLGENVRIGAYTKIKCSGTIRDIGEGLKIGNNSGIGEFSYFGAAGGIRIGNDVIMGQNIRFHSENHNFDDVNIPIRQQGITRKGIEIGDDCWIGAGVVFLDGIRVGKGCVVGANTIVNKNIPDYSIAVGNPVKVIGNRKERAKNGGKA